MRLTNKHVFRNKKLFFRNIFKPGGAPAPPGPLPGSRFADTAAAARHGGGGARHGGGSLVGGGYGKYF